MVVDSKRWRLTEANGMTERERSFRALYAWPIANALLQQLQQRCNKRCNSSVAYHELTARMSLTRFQDEIEAVHHCMLVCHETSDEIGCLLTLRAAPRSAGAVKERE